MDIFCFQSTNYLHELLNGQLNFLGAFLSYKIHCNILNVGNWGWEIQFSTCIWSQSIGAIRFWEETGENTFFSYL